MAMQPNIVTLIVLSIFSVNCDSPPEDITVDDQKNSVVKSVTVEREFFLLPDSKLITFVKEAVNEIMPRWGAEEVRFIDRENGNGIVVRVESATMFRVTIECYPCSSLRATRDGPTMYDVTRDGRNFTLIPLDY